MNAKSFVHFKDGRIKNGTNDGMKLLGEFLLEQVGTKTAFFTHWLAEKTNDVISASSYMLEKKGDIVTLSHLNASATAPFQTTRQEFTSVLEHWRGLCKSETHSVCKVGGYEVILERNCDTDKCTFHTLVD
jgi:hypothetical protein